MTVFSEDPLTVFRRLNGDGDGLTMEQLATEWQELREIIDDDDLTIEELADICPGSSVLSEEDFVALHEKIEALFEDDGDVKETDDSANMDEAEFEILSVKETLLEYFKNLRSSDGARLPCGFDCGNREREAIQQAIDAIQQEPANIILRNGGRLKSTEVMGNWSLLYTTSRTMSINKSLSGLGRSTSDKAIFQGIEMRLTGNKFLGQVEFVETFGGDGDVSLDVSVVGEWMLEDGRNIFTGLPSSSLRVDPDTITYGFSTNKADDWDSLGPIKLLDFLYFDSDLMILRGTANTDSHFIYQRARARLME
jgi:hypothetical protein